MRADIQERIRAKGREIFQQITDQKGESFLSRAWVTSRLMEWSMGNERLKGELFRFIDVLPSLSDSAEIARHAHEYLTQPGVDVRGAMPLAVSAGRAVPSLTAA